MSQYSPPPGAPWGANGPAAPAVADRPPKPTTGPVLGWIALGIGVVAIVLAVVAVFRVPFVGGVALILGVAGVILGIVALALRSRPRVFGVVGLVASAAACVTVVVVIAVVATQVISSVVGGISVTTIAPAASGVVVFEATGSTPSATIAYGAGTSANIRANTKELPHQSLPFSTKETIRLTGTDTVVVSVSGSGSLHCRVTVNGMVVAENTADNLVVCTGVFRS